MLYLWNGPGLTKYELGGTLLLLQSFWGVDYSEFSGAISRWPERPPFHTLSEKSCTNFSITPQVG